MNYAIDALWWRLTDQHVRDLAVLLTAPAPWPSGMELDVTTLLGTQGFRYLLALDQQPKVLHTWLQSTTFQRLGSYAEKLLNFWLTHAPHCELVAANVPVCEAGRTLGEYDFLVRINGEPLHIELTCKYYFMAGNGPHTLLGLNLKEYWLEKQQKLSAQLTLASRAAGQQALPAGFDSPHSVSVVRGTLFYHDQPWLTGPLSGLQWNGWWRRATEDWPVTNNQSRWLLLPRLQWLSPARTLSSTVSLDDLRVQLNETASAQMIAECEARPDGSWHEIARGVIVPDSFSIAQSGSDNR